MLFFRNGSMRMYNAKVLNEHVKNVREESKEISVLSLNLWGRKGPYEDRVSRIDEWLKCLEPDIVGFQECLRIDYSDEVTCKLHKLGYYTAFGQALSKAPGRGFGNLIASRWPIIKKEILKLPTPDDIESRIAITSIIQTPYGKLCLICTHLTWEPELINVRNQQITKIKKYVSEHCRVLEIPPVIVGDFNAEPLSPEIKSLTNRNGPNGTTYYLDAWNTAGDGSPGITKSASIGYKHTDFSSDRRIDYIFVGASSHQWQEYNRISSCSIVCNDKRNGVWPSDHFGVFAIINTNHYGIVNRD